MATLTHELRPMLCNDIQLPPCRVEESDGHLPLQAIEQVAASDLPLLATSRKCTCAVHESCAINAQHAHLGHGTDECSVPCTLADCEAVERNRRDRVLRDALIGWQGKGCFSSLGVGVVLVVPCTDCRVECCASLGRVGDELFSSCVSADKGGKINGREALGC